MMNKMKPIAAAGALLAAACAARHRAGRRRSGLERLQKDLRLIRYYGEDILASPGMRRSRRFLQHGRTSVYRHSLSVALLCLRLSRVLHLKVDRRAMVRGALLHDYFLYDWHDSDPDHRWHGFTHPKRALKNARADFPLGGVEADMIVSHMFPLTPKPPFHREGWILCGADKICSLRETLKRTNRKATGGRSE